MKCITVIGIRPDIIRLSKIIPMIDEYFENFLVDTGQHYSAFLNSEQYKSVDVREPDENMDVRSGTHGEQVANLVQRFEKILMKQKPKFVVILGDNNSSLGCALAAAKHGVPIAHIESGMRSYDWRMPEERNRRVIDVLSQIHFCYSEEARSNLIDEGVCAKNIFVVGNPIREVLLDYLPDDVSHEDIKDKILVTLHRHENIMEQASLGNIIAGLEMCAGELSQQSDFILMPKTAQQLKEFNISISKNFSVIDPQPYHKFMRMLCECRCVITDSGTVVEEAGIIGRPCVTIRKSTERHPIMESGHTVVSGVKPLDIFNAFKFAIHEDSEDALCDGLSGGFVAQKIVNILLSNWLEALEWRKYK